MEMRERARGGPRKIKAEKLNIECELLPHQECNTCTDSSTGKSRRVHSLNKQIESWRRQRWNIMTEIPQHPHNPNNPNSPPTHTTSCLCVSVTIAAGSPPELW
jgi:hypothetical protein